MVYEYKLSDNDRSEIKYHAKDKQLSTLAEKALTILSYMYGGLHNMPWKHRERFAYDNSHMVSVLYDGSLATWDSNKLTTLVVLAHELCLRVEISPCAFRYITIKFWERQGRTGPLWDRHPTMDQVLEYWRSDKPM